MDAKNPQPQGASEGPREGLGSTETVRDNEASPESRASHPYAGESSYSTGVDRGTPVPHRKEASRREPDYPGQLRSSGAVEWVEEHRDEITEMEPISTSVQPCFVRACGRSAQVRGLCHPHYRRAKRRFGGDAL